MHVLFWIVFIFIQFYTIFQMLQCIFLLLYSFSPKIICHIKNENFFLSTRIFQFAEAFWSLFLFAQGKSTTLSFPSMSGKLFIDLFLRKKLSLPCLEIEFTVHISRIFKRDNRLADQFTCTFIFSFRHSFLYKYFCRSLRYDPIFLHSSWNTTTSPFRLSLNRQNAIVYSSWYADRSVGNNTSNDFFLRFHVFWYASALLLLKSIVVARWYFYAIFLHIPYRDVHWIVDSKHFFNASIAPFSYSPH